MLSHDEFISALERCFYRAFRDTGGSERVANFLLAWENAPQYGGFDIRDMWGLDVNYSRDVIDVFEYMSDKPYYFNNYGFTPHLRKVILQWRRKLYSDDVLEEFRQVAEKVPIQPIYQLSIY